MARLSTRVCSLFTDNSITHLRARKIFTFVDFLREDPEKLVKICHLSYPEIMMIRRNLISHYSAFPKTGLDAYHELLLHSALIPFGVSCLDNILDGGLLTGTLTELYGSSSNGKTQICFAITANVILNLKQKVHYIDTKGGFSGKRMKDILEKSGSSRERVEEALQNVIVTSVKSINELLSFLHYIKGSLNQDNIDGIWTRLIIIDSLPALFYQFIGEASNQGLGFMNNLAAILRCIAIENRLAFLLVNLANKGSENEDELTDPTPRVITASFTPITSLRPALGNYWFHVPNLRLLVRKNVTSNEVEVVVTKSSYVQLGKRCKFHLHETAIKSV
ncbi:DNA repair protein RAD51 homolog 4 [Hetaerina americana]|uniref:DNA repair protein RAD51 homolog 4 n=1 Tax=Hetaerina americana TaxID=62018 RepID=UPI003A7F2E08